MGNGVGPYWFHPKLRQALTKLAEMFFDEASWDRHDYGYKHKICSRWLCDLRFLQAMLRDASRKDQIWRMLGCVFLAWNFWLFVRLFGWISYGRNKSD